MTLRIRHDYTNSHLKSLINEHVHSERNRKILKRRLVDGVCYDKIADEFGLSVRQTQRIVNKLEKQIFKISP